jgi:hypothetical protein
MSRSIFERVIFSYKFYRFLEALPGLISWTCIAIPIVFSFFAPDIAAYFVLFYAVYWVYNAIKFVVLAYVAHEKVLYVVKQDWFAKLKQEFPEHWNEYYYCAIIPFASESINIIRPTIESILNNNYPNNRKIICLSSEKALPKGKEIALELQKEFGDKFAYFFITEHKLKPGELKGKASNQNHAGRFVYKELTSRGINPERVLLTSNDADMMNHKEYIPYLIYKFLLEGENGHKRIYQPVPTDYSGVWDARFFSRIIVTLGVQWRLALAQRNNYRLTVYSFYSMSLKTLHDIGFWDIDNIPEDERTMFKAIFTYGKDFRVIPLFIPTAGRPVQAQKFVAAVKEQYIQMRRWAWGASEFAHAFIKSVETKDIPWRVKILPLINQVRTAVEWSLSSVLPMFGGMIPGLVNEKFRLTELSYAVPSVMSLLFSISASMILLIILVDLRLAPKPQKQGFFFRISTFAQWILVPFVGLFLSSLPALDAQTRLIFNKRIVYVESKKE